MDKNKIEILKNEILDKVAEYYKLVHDKSSKKFEAGVDRINYAGRVFDEKEMLNLVDSSLEFWLTYGKYSAMFEKKLANFLNIKYAFLVNSGSSANLLAFMTLTSPLLKERQIKRGDEVITIACGFPTTISPIVQYGATPVFVDIELNTLNLDVSKLESALSPKTKAIMIAHTLGNPFDLNSIKEFCDKNNLWLIEDNCDALGSRYNEKFTGTFGDIGTSSFYPPHHITMGEGGAVYTDNLLLKKIILSLRDWGRDCWCESGVDNTCNNRFSQQFGELPFGYDHKYVYSHFGYNLKTTDMQASIGVAQLDKLENFTQKRIKNFNLIYNSLKDANLDKYFILPSSAKESEPSWFGFVLILRDNVKFSRNEIVQYLEKNHIQTRNLFGGNLIKQPLFSDLNEGSDYRVVGDLINTDRVMNDSFWIGVYPDLKEEQIEYIIETMKGFFNG